MLIAPREHVPADRLTPERIALLRCPVCREALSLAEAAGGRPRHVRCDSCRRGYPISDGLPILLADRSFPESS
jgi:uncharacterized protein YbaR (Trm112 family)